MQCKALFLQLCHDKLSSLEMWLSNIVLFQCNLLYWSSAIVCKSLVSKTLASVCFTKSLLSLPSVLSFFGAPCRCCFYITCILVITWTVSLIISTFLPHLLYFNNYMTNPVCGILSHSFTHVFYHQILQVFYKFLAGILVCSLSVKVSILNILRILLNYMYVIGWLQCLRLFYCIHRSCVSISLIIGSANLLAMSDLTLDRSLRSN